MSDLSKLVAELEKVNVGLGKKQTDTLRAKQSDLMGKIQQVRQKQREEAGPADGPAPDSVSGGIAVNKEQ